MSRSTITTTVTNTVVLGSGGYGNALTVTATGAVLPSQAEATGVYAPAALGSATLLNQGVIAGGTATGAALPMGGIGVDFAAAQGSINNAGTISGGGGYGHGHGGAGVVSVGSVHLKTAGTIQGGHAGYGDAATSSAGAGVMLGANSVLDNAGGTILGGSGTYGKGAQVGSEGGAGVVLASGMVSNGGTIAGGNGGLYFYQGLVGGNGGAGAILGSGSVMFNHRVVQGGAGGGGVDYGATGGIGVQVSAGATLVNDSGAQIAGGVGGFGVYSGAEGGAGVAVLGGLLSNAGTISGAAGGTAFYTQPLASAGVTIGSYGTVSNVGTILGGAHAYGASGIDATSAALITNHGIVQGGDAATGVGIVFGRGDGIFTGQVKMLRNSGTIQGGTYGAGISTFATTAFGTLLNSGLIAGGAAGAGFQGDSAVIANSGTILGGAGYQKFGGGAGAVLATGETLTSTGVIAGGAGSAGGSGAAAGGAGVVLDGGTLVAAGQISGGAGAHGGSNGDAVQFGTLASTLVVDPTATFVGNIVTDTSVADTLALAGHTAGHLAGFGTSVTGFTDIVAEAKSHWDLSGTITAGTLTLGGGSSLGLEGPARLQAVAFAAPGTTLQLGDAAHFTGAISGFGNGDVIDLQNVLANELKYSKGTLTLLGGAGEKPVAKLVFSGTYTAADFALQPDHAGGTEIVFAGGGAGAPSSYDRLDWGRSERGGMDAFLLAHLHFGG